MVVRCDLWYISPGWSGHGLYHIRHRTKMVTIMILASDHRRSPRNIFFSWCYCPTVWRAAHGRCEASSIISEDPDILHNGCEKGPSLVDSDSSQCRYLMIDTNGPGSCPRKQARVIASALQVQTCRQFILGDLQDTRLGASGRAGP